VWVGGLFILFLFVLDGLIGWFTQSSEVRDLAWFYVMLIVPSLAPLAAVLYINTLYVATGKPFVALKFTLLRVALLLPVAWLFMEFYQAAGIFVAIAVANLVGGMFAFSSYKRSFKQTIG
jgi:Na+-driven multidrug efflux pump